MGLWVRTASYRPHSAQDTTARYSHSIKALTQTIRALCAHLLALLGAYIDDVAFLLLDLYPSLFVISHTSHAQDVTCVVCACSGRRELVYTYDGLYSVDTATMERGQEGFQVCK